MKGETKGRKREISLSRGGQNDNQSFTTNRVNRSDNNYTISNRRIKMIKEIKEQIEWGKQFYEVADNAIKEMRPRGYSDEEIATMVYKLLKPAKNRDDFYGIFAISFWKEMSADSRIYGLVRWEMAYKA